MLADFTGVANRTMYPSGPLRARGRCPLAPSGPAGTGAGHTKTGGRRMATARLRAGEGSGLAAGDLAHRVVEPEAARIALARVRAVEDAELDEGPARRQERRVGGVPEVRIRLHRERLVVLVPVADERVGAAVGVPVGAVERLGVLAAGVSRGVDLRALLHADVDVGALVAAEAGVLGVDGGPAARMGDDRRLDPVDDRVLVVGRGTGGRDRGGGERDECRHGKKRG